MQDDLKLEAYDYHLPAECIAQVPAEKRDHSRLMVLNRTSGSIEHLHFHQVTRLFAPGDLMVLNDTRVFPARLMGSKESGGKAEVFLLGYPTPVNSETVRSVGSRFHCEALIKSSRPPQNHSKIFFDEHSYARVFEPQGRGRWRVELVLDAGTHLDMLLDHRGEVPLPPYIKREQGTSDQDRSRYQTVYADQPGAVAAPTAGLHFTDALLERLRNEGVGTAAITLHVGYGTFAPVQEEDISNHHIHREYIEISHSTAEIINQTKADGGKFGKTESGNVWLDPDRTSPYAFYQFWLNVSDEDAEKYLKIFTMLSREEIAGLVESHQEAPHQRIMQKKLAEEVTVMVHTRGEYEMAVEASGILFGRGTAETLSSLREDVFLAVFEGVPQYTIPVSDLDGDILELLAVKTEVFPSKGEARRMVSGGGVSVNKQKVSSPDQQVGQTDLINGKYLLVQKGKKNYYLITVKASN